jgi:hypothetical protein
MPDPALIVAEARTAVRDVRDERTAANGQAFALLAATGGALYGVLSWGYDSLPLAGRLFWFAGITAGFVALTLFGAAICPSRPRQGTVRPGRGNVWELAKAAEDQVLGQILTATDAAAAEHHLGVLSARVCAPMGCSSDCWCWPR